MDLSYIAHSERCALLLDQDGVCRWAVPKVDANDEVVVAAKRCIGAQFLASLDPDVPGFMTSEPRLGRYMLFAAIANGRVALLRFGPLQSFERLDPAETVSETAEAPSAPDAQDQTDAPPRTAAAQVSEERTEEGEERGSRGGARGGVRPRTVVAASKPAAVSDDPADQEVTLDGPMPPETAAEVTTAEREPDVLPPTIERSHLIAKVPDLDDVLASFAQEALDAEPLDLDDVTDDGADEEDPTLSHGPGADEEEVTLSRAAPGMEEPTPPPSPDSSSAIATMAFERDEKAAELDDLLANAARPRPRPVGRPALPSRLLGDGVQESLDRITLLTSSKPETLNDSQLDVITDAFDRSEKASVLPASDLELEIDTSDLTEEVVAKNPLASRVDPPEHPVRPSGLLRRAIGMEADVDDASTRPFLRASGDTLASGVEPARTDLFDLGRHGMLPRR